MRARPSDWCWARAWGRRGLLRAWAGKRNGRLEAAEAWPRFPPFTAIVSLVTGSGEGNLDDQSNECVDGLEGGIQGRTGLAFDLHFQAFEPATVAGLDVLAGRAFGLRSAAEIVADDLPINPPGAGVVTTLFPAHMNVPSMP
jgi:hypothetical protein